MPECEFCHGWIGPWPCDLIDNPEAYSCSCDASSYEIKAKIEEASHD